MRTLPSSVVDLPLKSVHSRLGLVLAAAMVGCATPQRAKPQEVVPVAPAETPRGRAESLVGRPGPLPAQDWTALGPDALRALQQIANDPAETPDRRTRAIGGMSALDDAQVSKVLAGYASDANEPPSLRGEAVVGLAEHDGAASVPTIVPFLADAQAQVRLSAAHALGLAGGDAAKAALQARVDVETDPSVRDELQKALTKTVN